MEHSSTFTILLAITLFATTHTKWNVHNSDNAQLECGYIITCLPILITLLSSHLFLLVDFSLAVLYLSWYSLTFIRRVFKSPDAPLEYPYFIPFFGHSLAMLLNPQRLVDKARLYLDNNRRPFTISALGYNFHFLTDHKDAVKFYSHGSLTHDTFLDDLMKQFNISDTTRDLIFWQPGATGLQLLSANPLKKSLARLTVDMFSHHMMPGMKLHRLGEITMASIEPLTRYDNMNSSWYTIREDNGFRYISLLHWCEEIMLKTANRTFFGESLNGVAPNIIGHFLKFDVLSFCAIFQYPYLLSRFYGMTQARDELVADLERYFRLPVKMRDDCNWFIALQEKEFKNLGFTVEDIAKLTAMTFWVINTNAYKVLFWMLCYMLQDPKLTCNITTELKDLFSKDGTFNFDALTERDSRKMPFTNALWHEVLRVTGSASSARSVTEDAVVCDVYMRKGDRAIIPYRQLHYNATNFGNDVAEFNFYRWIDNEKLEKKSFYRPFGGGAWYCPGRHLAKQEILMAMAFLLYRYEVEIAPEPKQKAPRMDEKVPGIGVISPMQGDDYVLRMRERDWERFEAQKTVDGEYSLPKKIVRRL